jgi:hypothetical protein
MINKQKREQQPEKETSRRSIMMFKMEFSPSSKIPRDPYSIYYAAALHCITTSKGPGNKAEGADPSSKCITLSWKLMKL